MKDATKVNNILLTHDITRADFARGIKTSPQNVQNMFRLNVISKLFLLPTVRFLREYEEDITIEWLLEDNHKED